MIIPFAGGSASDVVSRIMLDKMSKIMGQPIIVENRPGAGGNTGTAPRRQGRAGRLHADRRRLRSGRRQFALYKSLGYDPEKDLEMISPFAGFTIVVVASKNLPVKSLKELIEYAKANPGKLNYGSVGIGSSQHLAGEYFTQVTGTKITHVPYRNIAQYGPDLIAGTVPLGFQWYPNVAGADRRQGRHPAGGRRRQADPGAARHADHHRSRDAGIQGATAGSRCWRRRGTPKPILEKLNKELNAALDDPAGEGRASTSAGAETIGCRSTRRRSCTTTKSPSTATSSPRPASPRSSSRLPRPCE